MSFSETEHPQDRHRPGSLSSLQLSRRIADYGRLLHLNRELPGNAVYDLGTGRHSAWELWLILAAFTAVQNNRLLVLRNLNPQFRVFPRRIGPVNQPRNHRCRDTRQTAYRNRQGFKVPLSKRATITNADACSQQLPDHRGSEGSGASARAENVLRLCRFWQLDRNHLS